MGEVFEAFDLAASRRVALKVVNRALATGTLRERLRREAEAARRVRSPYVPQLYDVDETAEGELFLVMERLYGETLAARLRVGALGWPQLARIGEDVLRGLVDAHAAGVIHRDLKPSNIFLEAAPGRGERARVLDFGVCKLDAHDGDPLTTTGESVGTVAYMAPEQIRGAAAVDIRADLYGFAMVVFEAVCGRLAHDAQGSIALIACKLEKPARSVRDLGRIATPPGLEPLLARCLARSPAERPASAAGLLGEWQALGVATVAPALPPGGAPVGDLTEAGLTASPTQVTARAKRRTRAGLLVATVALVASSGVLVAGLRLRAHSSTADGPRTMESAASHASAAPSMPMPSELPAPPAVSASSVDEVPFRSIGSASGTSAAPRVQGEIRGGGKRTLPAGRGRPTNRRPPMEPQIATEPRY
jgi:serine/threonine-protein kinase